MVENDSVTERMPFKSQIATLVSYDELPLQLLPFIRIVEAGFEVCVIREGWIADVTFEHQVLQALFERR